VTELARKEIFTKQSLRSDLLAHVQYSCRRALYEFCQTAFIWRSDLLGKMEFRFY
jgi:hypothetical protein